MGEMTLVLPRAARSAACFLLIATVFSLAYCQAPLYYSNQNQYLLHGLARAGVGHLQEDWLATTRDPTPLFSAWVCITAQIHLPWLFHVYCALLLGIYAVALLGLFTQIVGWETARRRLPLFAAIFVLIHAGLLRWCSYHWLGNDYPWFLQAGVAGQYVLGPVFQPSTVGVFLLAAIYCFGIDRSFLAIGLAALAASFHPTYLLQACLLILGFLTSQVLEHRARLALLTGALAVVFVLPIASYVLVAFGPTDGKTLASAEEVLVNVRIPHHARVDLWFDRIAAIQLLGMVVGILLIRPRRLRIALTVSVALASLLTVVQVLTKSNSLALLFPWRISAILMPVATTVVIARLIAVLPAIVEGRCARLLGEALVTACVVGGVWIMVERKGFYMNEEELPLLSFVRENLGPGEVYFVPVSVPQLSLTTRGSLSSDFKPMADKRHDPRVIPYDLQRFRLMTGAPIYVDFKSLPYKDSEVLEWRHRIRIAELTQSFLDDGRSREAVDELRSSGVTHLVVPVGLSVSVPGVRTIYQDAQYRIDRLDAPPAGTSGPVQ